MSCRIIDTFDDFLRIWPEMNGETAEQMLQVWQDNYMSRWPELLNRQLAQCGREGADWRKDALERIFPHLDQRLAAMSAARDVLVETIRPVYEAAHLRLGYQEDASFVIYVGVGLGAGWATTYEGQPAVLLGLENIAECRWTDRPTLEGMLAHEIGHLYHYWRRRMAGLAGGSGALWDLYEEGFAQRCEHVVLGRESWHMGKGINSPDWTDWCRANLAFLAGEFLRRVEVGEAVTDFFGHWFDIQGRRQSGYFLGHELIRRLETRISLATIAALPDPLSATRNELAALAKR